MAARVTRTELLSEALALDADDRAKLAADLLASLDGECDPGAEQEWRAEVRMRMDDVLDGKVQGIAADEVLAELESDDKPEP